MHVSSLNQLFCLGPKFTYKKFFTLKVRNKISPHQLTLHLATTGHDLVLKLVKFNSAFHNISLTYRSLTAFSYSMSFNVSIAHVAVRKRHQQQDEIIVFFTHTILKSAKLFFFSASTHAFHTSLMLYGTHALIASAQAYAVQTGLR